MWNKTRYNKIFIECSDSINGFIKTPFDWMHNYKKMIVNDDFEGAKAVTDVLKPLNYDTKDTHNHIAKLWK